MVHGYTYYVLVLSSPILFISLAISAAERTRPCCFNSSFLSLLAVLLAVYKPSLSLSRLRSFFGVVLASLTDCLELNGTSVLTWRPCPSSPLSSCCLSSLRPSRASCSACGGPSVVVQWLAIGTVHLSWSQVGVAAIWWRCGAKTYQIWFKLHRCLQIRWQNDLRWICECIASGRCVKICQDKEKCGRLREVVAILVVVVPPKRYLQGYRPPRSA